MKKLTAITVNGKAVFVPLPVDLDGKTRAPASLVAGILNTTVDKLRGMCMRWG